MQTLFPHDLTDGIKFGVNRLMEKPESEDEDASVYQAKSLITCDSPSNLSVTRTKSRSRSRSHSRSRSSSSSSSELEVDSPPPPRITISPLTDIPHVRCHFDFIQDRILGPFRSFTDKEIRIVLSLSAVARRSTKNVKVASIEQQLVREYKVCVRLFNPCSDATNWLITHFINRPSYGPHIYEQNVLSRPLFHPFPLFAMLQQGQQQQQQQNTSLSG